MSKKVKSIIIYIIAALLVIIIYTGFNNYREKLLSNTIKDTLQKYFKDNNTHIASRNFNINDIRIRCEGNDAYIVEFNILFNDNNSNNLNNLSATIYKTNNTWHVKGFGSGITNDELKLYKFRCYY
jgi:hypothetical protein